MVEMWGSCILHIKAIISTDTSTPHYEHIMHIIQEFTPANDIDNEHSIEGRSTHATHDEYEVLAQATCTNIAIARGESGWIYAVRRHCGGHHYQNCKALCLTPHVSHADHETRYRKWKSIGGIHVYAPRPTSATYRPYLGLKVLWIDTYDQNTRCGPNFCCCFAQ